ALVWQDYAPLEATPAIDIGFVAAENPAAQAGDVEIRLERLALAGEFGLWLTCLAAADELTLRIGFDPARHPRDQVVRLARALTRIIATAAADPSVRIGDVDILDDDERRLVLETFNATGAADAGGTVHERFAEHAARAPERDAVVDVHATVTYAELEARANQL